MLINLPCNWDRGRCYHVSALRQGVRWSGKEDDGARQATLSAMLLMQSSFTQFDDSNGKRNMWSYTTKCMYAKTETCTFSLPIWKNQKGNRESSGKYFADHCCGFSVDVVVRRASTLIEVYKQHLQPPGDLCSGWKSTHRWSATNASRSTPLWGNVRLRTLHRSGCGCDLGTIVAVRSYTLWMKKEKTVV